MGERTLNKFLSELQVFGQHALYSSVGASRNQKSLRVPRNIKAVDFK